MKIGRSIGRAFETLKNDGEIASSKKWQAIDSPDDLFEIINGYYIMEMPENIEELGKQCAADLPWAENHFQERVSRNPANPGYEYLNWPYYKPSVHNSKFRSEGETYFSHTYMERFWPNKELIGTGKMGYHFGDFDDLVARMKEDPGTRQAFYAIWHPQDSANDGVRLPCTIGYHFLIRNGVLHITYLIRSCDIFRHFKNDIYMTVRLAQYVRDAVDPTLKLGKLNMWIGSLHCWNIEKTLLDTQIMKYEGIY
jgi:thymidylate synthase